MARTPSNMLPLGTIAPGFNLPDTITDKMVSLGQIKGVNGTLIMFICNHCPFVKHVNSTITQLATNYQAKGIAFSKLSARRSRIDETNSTHRKL